MTMTELEMLAKFTVENNGKWMLLEEQGDCKLFETTKPFEFNYYYYSTTPVYQIFINGKRVLATTNYSEAYQCFFKLFKGGLISWIDMIRSFKNIYWEKH